MAIVRGDPGKPGRFVVRFRLPDGFVVSPHFHPVDEHVRVIRGEYGHGFGDVADTTKMHWLRAGQRVTLPAKSHPLRESARRDGDGSERHWAVHGDLLRERRGGRGGVLTW